MQILGILLQVAKSCHLIIANHNDLCTYIYIYIVFKTKSLNLKREQGLITTIKSKETRSSHYERTQLANL